MEDGAERNQAPTQKRLEDARREGRVLTSKEVMVFVGMAAGTLVALILPRAGPWVAARWAAHLRLEGVAALDGAMLPALVAAGQAVLLAGLAVALPVAQAAVAAQAAMAGLRWSARGFAFRPDRLDPVKGLGRMLSPSALVELVKALAKLAALLLVTYRIGRAALPDLAALAQMPPGDAVAVLAGLVVRLFASLTLVLGLIAAADLLWQWRKLSASLRMTLDEVKRESREDNGSPELKARQRRMQVEASRRGRRERAALADVPTATAVITNPSHFAVALRYAAGRDAAPVIIATGRDRMAAEVIAGAHKAGVPVLSLPPLARALYFTGDIGTPIHEGLYGAVAAVLAHVWRLERGLAEDLPEIDLPQDLRFDARGRRAG